MTLPLLAVGAVGVVGVATHWTGEDHQSCSRSGTRATWSGQAGNSRLLESFAYETGDEAPNPIPTKALLRMLGLAVGEARLPMGPAPEGLEDRAREVLANLERWRAAYPDRPDRQSA